MPEGGQGTAEEEALAREGIQLQPDDAETYPAAPWPPAAVAESEPSGRNIYYCKAR